MVLLIKEASKLISENKIFFLLYLIFLIAGLPLLIFYPKGVILIFLNGNHSSFLDLIFSNSTNLGDGIFFAIMLIPLSFKRVRLGLIGLVSFLSSGIAVQIIKHLIVLPRPAEFLDNAHLHLVEGVTFFHYNSFPSGHSASIFALCSLLAIITRNKYIGILFFFCGLTVAVSRVYLAQHFFIDVYFGSLFGIVFNLLSYIYINRIKAKNSNHWLEKPLLNLLIKK